MTMVGTNDGVGEASGRAGKIPRRRRFWSRAAKQRIVAETYEAGASVSVVARRHDINANQVFTWRRQAQDGRLDEADRAAPVFVPVKITPAKPVSAWPTGATSAAAMASPQAGTIEIDLGDGRFVRVGRDVDASALRRVLAVLERR